MKNVLFIGVTGFLGQFWAMELLKNGYYLIFLARTKNGQTAEERVHLSLSFIDQQTSLDYRHMYSVVEGGLFDFPDMGKNIDIICNAAGATSFAEKDRDETTHVNLDGTVSMLEFADKYGPSEIHYTSTAYVNDPACPVAREDSLDCTRTYRNPYAESKCLAEQYVRTWAENNEQCKVFIYRPSIIVGDSKTGLTTNFFGYYRYMRSFSILKRAIMKKDDSSESIFIPIHVPGAYGATINIVSIDYVVGTIMKLHAAGVPGVYHITNSDPPKYEWLLKKSLEVLGITGPSSLRSPNETDLKFLRVQSKLRDGVLDYVPFVTDDIVFSQENVKEVLGLSFSNHSVVNKMMVETLLKFAVSCDFKKEKALKNLFLDHSVNSTDQYSQI